MVNYTITIYRLINGNEFDDDDDDGTGSDDGDDHDSQ